MFIFRTLLWPAVASLLLCMLTVSAATTGIEQQQLREHYTRLLNARSAFSQALALGELNQVEQADYRAWIQQLDTRVRQVCQQFSDTDKASLPADLPCNQILRDNVAPANINIDVESTDTEKTAVIVDQFSKSLGDFDEQLLQEQRRIKAKMPPSNSNSSASAGSASAGSADGSESDNPDNDQNASDRSQSTSTQDSAAKSENQQENSETPPGTRGQQGASGKSSSGTDNNTPENIPDGSDDDVVARQLREAAEKEQDPALKEKLWEEYRRYKAGTN